jgi:hypothetical protein
MKTIERLKIAITAVLRTGTAPEQIATALALGAVLGTFPIFGFSTLLCVLAAAALHLNQGLIQVANYAAYPLQFLSASASLALAAWFSGLGPADLAAATRAMRSDPWGILSSFKELLGWAVMIWMAAAPLLFALLRWGARRLVRKIPMPMRGEKS